MKIRRINSDYNTPYVLRHDGICIDNSVNHCHRKRPQRALQHNKTSNLPPIAKPEARQSHFSLPILCGNQETIRHLTV